MENSKLITVYLPIVAFLGIILVFSLPHIIDVEHENHKYKLEKQFKGVIEEKYRDKPNHNSMTIRINRKKITLSENVYNYIQLQDSVIKNKNQLTVQVYRGNALDTIIDY